jgi:hypothetical protein
LRLGRRPGRLGRNGFTARLGRSSGGGGALAAHITLADACGLASKLAQVIELGATDATPAHNVYAINDASVKREYALDADSETGLTHGDSFAHARMLAGYDDSLERLYALFVAFLDSHVNANSVSGLKLRYIIAELPILDSLDYLIHGDSPRYFIFFL